MNYKPLKMRPCYKEYLWGGTHLKTSYGRQDAPKVTAESWELASHPDGCSVVQEGEYANFTLDDLGQMDRAAFWGSACTTEKFPLLVKLIDAEKDLSIQVHPSDETARKEYGEAGKAEMWYIVDCKPQAAIYIGFSEHISNIDFLRRAREGTICDVLNRVQVKKGDVFFILPGMIHAIGAGILVAEIQQNSNTTFRVYDYNRQDSNGMPRALHLERAAEVVNYTPLIPSECRSNNTSVFPEFSMTEMFSCPYFRAYRVDIKTSAKLSCDGKSFQNLLCVDGNGSICTKDGEWSIQKGESYFLPAAMGAYEIKGVCRVLLSCI